MAFAEGRDRRRGRRTGSPGSGRTCASIARNRAAPAGVGGGPAEALDPAPGSSSHGRPSLRRLPLNLVEGGAERCRLLAEALGEVDLLLARGIAFRQPSWSGRKPKSPTWVRNLLVSRPSVPAGAAGELVKLAWAAAPQPQVRRRVRRACFGVEAASPLERSTSTFSTWPTASKKACWYRAVSSFRATVRPCIWLMPHSADTPPRRRGVGRLCARSYPSSLFLSSQGKDVVTDPGDDLPRPDPRGDGLRRDSKRRPRRRWGPSR